MVNTRSRNKNTDRSKTVKSKVPIPKTCEATSRANQRHKMKKLARAGQDLDTSLNIISKQYQTNTNTTDNFKYLVSYFRENSTFDEELKIEAANFQVPASLNNNFINKYAERWLRLFLESRQYRILNPLRYLTFNEPKHEVDLNIMHRNPEMQSKSGIKAHDMILKKYGVRQTCINFSTNNRAFDWQWFEIRRREKELESPMASVKFVHKFPAMFKERFNKAESAVQNLRVQNNGEFITKEQLTYEVCLNISNFTEIVKNYLEANGRDEYNEDQEHFPIFKEWWSEKYSSLRKRWKLRGKWRLVDEEELDRFRSEQLSSINFHTVETKEIRPEADEARPPTLPLPTQQTTCAEENLNEQVRVY